MFQDIIYEKKDHVATITINRPEVYNAFRTQTILEMIEAIEDASDDGSIGVIVIRGAGGKAFCSGGDIAEMKELTPETGRTFLRRFFTLLHRIREAPKPVIAAVDGYCLGGGNEINMACDLTIATKRSKFGQVGPTVGSIPVLGGTQLLPLSVGEKKAKEIVFLCKRYSAEEAEKMGWVNLVVDDDKLDEAVKEWCDRILEMSPQSIRISKLSLNYQYHQTIHLFEEGIDMLSSLYDSEELKEGMTAFLEKRKPDFNKFRK